MIDDADALPGSGTRPRTESAEIDLPEPDSPTRASTSPLPMSKFTPCTTSTSSVVPGRGKRTERFRTDNRAFLSGLAETELATPAADPSDRSARSTSPTPTRPPRASRPNASRNPSPKTLNATTVTKIAIPGGNAGQIDWSIDSWALRKSLPQLACFGPAPRPKKLRAASASTDVANNSVVCTMSTGAMLGKM